MSLRTNKSLQKLFNESKLRQEKQKEERKRQKQLAYQALCRKQDILLKKALRDEKKKVMDNLSTLIKKTPQEPQKPSQIEIETYQAKWQMYEPNQSDLYHTWDELKEAEKRGEGALNWTKLQQIITDTKAMLNNQ